jgi:prevent-host-death family protein
MTAKTAGRRPDERLNEAEAKTRFSDLLARVAYGGETILITRWGRPMARLVPVGREEPGHLAEVRGWLDGGDPFFAEIEALVQARKAHQPRVLDRPLDEETRGR